MYTFFLFRISILIIKYHNIRIYDLRADRFRLLQNKNVVFQQRKRSRTSVDDDSNCGGDARMPKLKKNHAYEKKSKQFFLRAMQS